MAASGRPYHAFLALPVARCQRRARNKMAAGEVGRGHLRASHADREHVIGMLKTAFVQGRLTKDELDARVGRTLASRTYSELAALTADLPTGLTAARPPRQPVRTQPRPPMNTAAKVGICVAVAVVVPTVLSFLTGGLALLCSHLSMSWPWWLPVPRYSSRGMRRSVLAAGSYRRGPCRVARYPRVSKTPTLTMTGFFAKPAGPRVPVTCSGMALFSASYCHWRYAGTGEGLRTFRSSHNHSGPSSAA